MRRPAIGLLAAVAISIGAAPAAAACRGAAAHPTSTRISTVNKATLCLLNAERKKRGLAPLKENSKLDKASVGHSRDMVRRKYFEHGDFAGRIKASGYLSGALSYGIGENIAWGGGGYSTPRSIVSMWMHSPGHRANILSRTFKEIGIGIARGAPESGQGGDAATYTTDFGFRRG
jgi:uncharacterized protein YkwD